MLDQNHSAVSQTNASPFFIHSDPTDLFSKVGFFFKKQKDIHHTCWGFIFKENKRVTKSLSTTLGLQSDDQHSMAFSPLICVLLKVKTFSKNFAQENLGKNSRKNGTYNFDIQLRQDENYKPNELYYILFTSRKNNAISKKIHEEL